MLESVNGNDRRLSALVPDGVTQVTVNLADGSTQDAMVSDNAIHLRLRGPMVDLTYTAPDGTHTTPAHAPGE